MSQRVVIVVGGCVLLGVGVLIGQSSNTPPNGEDRRFDDDVNAGMLSKHNSEREADDYPPDEALERGTMPNRLSSVATAERTTRPNPERSSDTGTTPQSQTSPFGHIEPSGSPPAFAGPFDEVQPPPSTLPPQQNASPIRKSLRSESPRSLITEKSVRDIIREELPNASDVVVDAYEKSLKGHSPHEVRNILEQRRTHGSLLKSDPSIRKKFVATRPQWRALPRDIPDSFPPVRNQPRPYVISDRNREVDLPAQLQPALKSLRMAQKILLNNIANANTPGFKRTRIHFADLPYQRIPSSGAEIGQGSSIASSLRDWNSGPLRQTDQPLDVAIVGKGFFQVQAGEQIVYTRCGRLTMSADQNLVFSTARRQYLIEPTINVPNGTTRIDISSDGTISATFPSAQPQQIGQFQLARFASPDALAPLGNSLFAGTELSGAPQVGGPGSEGRGKLKPGFLETSNVDLKRELSRLRRVTHQLQAIQEAARLVTSTVPRHPQYKRAEEVTVLFKENGKTVGRLKTNVVRILPNGDLRIYGEKISIAGRNKSKCSLSGTVHPTDIGASDTIQANEIIDLLITREPEQPVRRLKSAPSPQLEHPTYRSLMNELKRRADHPTKVKKSSHAPKADSDRDILRSIFNSPEARDIERKLGFDIDVEHLSAPPKIDGSDKCTGCNWSSFYSTGLQFLIAIGGGICECVGIDCCR